MLVVLLDDAGFGSSSAFGGPCQTPTFERLARQGLRFNRFHTTALCSPTRQALLTGRNHHSVGMGGITEIATSAPGHNSIRPANAAPLAETLKLNGYSTAQLGKRHEVPVWETSPMGPLNQWPLGSGFEYFYGFVGAETNQWYPALYDRALHREETLRRMRGRGDRHRAGHRRPGRRGGQSGRHQHPTRGFGDAGDNGVQPAGAKAGGLEMAGRARQSATAEPAEEFLRSVGGHHPTHPDAQDQAGDVAACNRRHVVTFLGELVRSLHRLPPADGP